jgi:hypothetical protein
VQEIGAMSDTITEEEILVAEVESAALDLPREARARIAARLLGSLEPQNTRHDELWAAEIRERIRAVKAGEMKLISEEEAEAEELLR